MVDVSSLKPTDACIVSAVRTPLGSFQGSLAALSAVDLGAVAIRGALEHAGVAPSAVQEVFMGNVISSNIGQAPATQAALAAGLPNTVPCTAINKVCSSGLKAVILAAQTILAGDNDVVVAGGMESMSNIPHYLPAMRTGMRLGNAEVIDGMLRDGLLDAQTSVHMGECAEMCADKYHISRQQQDDNAVAAFQRAVAALESGATAREVVPVRLPPGRRSSGGVGGDLVTRDDALAKLNEQKLRALKPFFKKHGGSVTAGNASPITDGASALVLMSAAAAQRARAPVLAVVRGYGDANQDPQWFTTAPAAAIPKALRRAGLKQEQMDFWEINQAFSVVDLANQQLLGLDPETVNVFGGSVALGHPLGASGAVILTRLINVLRTRGGRYGCAAICNGGGGASAIVVEAVVQASSM